MSRLSFKLVTILKEDKKLVMVILALPRLAITFRQRTLLKKLPVFFFCTLLLIILSLSFASASNPSAKSFYIEGNKYLGKGLYPEAIKAYKQAVNLNPNLTEAHYKLGLLYSQENRWEEATYSFQRVIQLRPKFAKVYSDLGMVYYKQGKFKEAVGLFQQAVTLNNNDPAVFYNLGVTYVKIGDSKEAVKAFQQAVNLNSDDVDSYYALALLYNQAKNYKEAVETLKKVTKLKGDYVIAYYTLGLVYYKMGQLNESAEALRKAVKLVPNYDKAHLLLGVVYLRQGRLGEMVRSFQMASVSDKRLALFYRNIMPAWFVIILVIILVYNYAGYLFGVERTKPQQTMLKHQSLIMFVYLFLLMFVFLYFLWLSAKIDDLAVRVFLLVIIYPVLYLLYLVVFYTIKLITKVYLDSTKKSVKADDPEAYYERGLLYFNPFYQESAENFQQAIRLNPKLADVHLALGQTYEKLGLLEEAEKSYKEAVRLNSNLIKAYYFLGKLYLRLKNKDSALKQHEILLQQAQNKNLEATATNLAYSLSWLIKWHNLRG